METARGGIALEFRTIDRGSKAFQESVSAEQLAAMCRRAFGPEVQIRSAAELEGGMYNNTYCVDIGNERPVILRVAPEPAKQSRIEQELMRNEYASIPFFASVADRMPRVLFADWSHDVVARDYMWQTMLDGVPAHQGLDTYPGEHRRAFYEQLGAIHRTIHETRGVRFGRIAGPHYNTWSEFICQLLTNAVSELEAAGAGTDDVRQVLDFVTRGKAILNAVDEPHLLHGDLWVPNVMLDPDAKQPTITGIFDHDHALWGDPMYDWAVFMASRHSSSERDAFWRGYGPSSRPKAPEAVWRQRVYFACHLSVARLELNRLARHEELRQNHEDMRQLLKRLP